VYLGTVKFFFFLKHGHIPYACYIVNHCAKFSIPSYFLPLELMYSLELNFLEHLFYFLTLEDGTYRLSRSVFLNRRAVALYRALTSTIPGREMFSRNKSF